MLTSREYIPFNFNNSQDALQTFLQWVSHLNARKTKEKVDGNLALFGFGLSIVAAYGTYGIHFDASL